MQQIGSLGARNCKYGCYDQVGASCGQEHTIFLVSSVVGKVSSVAVRKVLYNAKF